MPINIGSIIIVGLLVMIPVAAIRSFILDIKERKEKKEQEAN